MRTKINGTMNIYTGIHDKDVPDHILVIMHNLSKFFASKNFLLRTSTLINKNSTAFQKGAEESKGSIQYYSDILYKNSSDTLRKRCDELIEKYYPLDIHKLDHVALLYYTAVPFQILGEYLDHASKFVVTWSSDGAEKSTNITAATGSIGYAINIADRYGIRVYNLQNKTSLNQLRNIARRLIYTPVN